MHQDGCFWGQVYFQNIPQWLLLLLCHVKEEQIFMNIFLSEGFSEKCKHTELALNFIQEQHFS